jgi:hypothetical protein
VKFFLSLLVVLACATTAALAQDEPSGQGPGGVPLGAGTQRGVQGLNNSGMTGFVTLFAKGPSTGVVVAIEGAKDRKDHVVIQRGQTCDAIQPAIAAKLPDLKRGMSRGVVHMTEDRLLSGNYLAVVYSGNSKGNHQLACGQLYR